MIRPKNVFHFTIESGQTTSNAVDLGYHLLHAIYVPAAFTGTSLSMQASLDGENWFTVMRDGATYSLTVAASSAHILTPAEMAFRYVRLVAGTAQASTVTLTAVAAEW